MRLAETVDLAGLVDHRVRLGVSTGANPGGKVATIVAGMAAGADSIDDLDLLRHGGLGACSRGSARRPRRGRTCARSPGDTCANWKLPAGTCWSNSPTAPRCCPART